MAEGTVVADPWNGDSEPIAGFAISGTTSDTVLIRGVGPSLGTLFGLRRALGASRVAVYDQLRATRNPARRVSSDRHP